MLTLLKLYKKVKLPRALTLIPIAFGSILSVSANEYQFDNFKFDQIDKEQNR